MPPSPTLLASRPTFEVGGQAQPGLATNLLRLNIRQDICGTHRCEAVFTNWGPMTDGKRKYTGYLYFDRQLLEYGKSVVIKLDSGSLMDGIIVSLGANFTSGTVPEFSVVIEDRFVGLRTESHTQTYEHMTDEAVVQLIAARHGLVPAIDYQGQTHAVLAQLDQSDLAFLRERARACNAELRIEGSSLNFIALPRQDADTVTLQYGQGLTKFTVVADIASQPSQVTACGWDVADKTADDHTSTDQTLSYVMHGGTSAASIVAAKIGQRTLALPLPVSSPQVAADAAFRALAQRFLVGHGSAQGNAHITVGANIRLLGLGPLFSGHYYVSEVNHVFDTQSGLVTNFTAESASLGQTQ